MTVKIQGCFSVSGAGDGSERAQRGWQTSERGQGYIVLALPVIWFLLQLLNPASVSQKQPLIIYKWIDKAIFQKVFTK